MKTLRLADIWRFGSNLFYSITVNGKTFFEKITCSMKQSNLIWVSGIRVRIFLLVLDGKVKLVDFFENLI